MPMLKKKPFEPVKSPAGLKDDEEVFYLKLTNEIFRDYDEYFARVILCNSMVWQCSLTGKANLTFQEALDSEQAARKQIKGFPKALKKALLLLTTLTSRAKTSDVVDDVVCYARDRYFKGEQILAVFGNLWCKGRVLNVIEPTPEEQEEYRKEQVEKGEAENNDYLKDDSWGPAPDIFRYQVEEMEPDDSAHVEVKILEAIDCKREKASFSKDKCKYMLKMVTDFDPVQRKVVVKPDVLKCYDMGKMKFSDIYVGKPPIFDESLAPLVKTPKSNSSISKTPKDSSKSDKVKKEGGSPKSRKSDTSGNSPSGKKSNTPGPASAKKSKGDGKAKKEKPVKKLSPEEIKLMELEMKKKEREKLKEQKKMIADFKKVWFKPREDLEVEDLKNLPTPDPIAFKIANHLFGDFVMVLEFLSSYSALAKVRDHFPTGMTFDILEQALTKNEVGGPLSDILQLLLKTIFRLQEGENQVISKDDAATAELDVNDTGDDVSVREAIQQATAAATWSYMYQNTPLHKLVVDYSSITEVLRLHLLSSGAKQSRSVGGANDDPGLQLRLDEPQIIRTLSTGTIFDLSVSERLKLVLCLVHQILSYSAVKDMMDESLDEFKQAKMSYRQLQAAEKKQEAEDQLWRHRLKADKQIPDLKALNAEAEKIQNGDEDLNKSVKGAGKNKEAVKSDKPPMTDEQIEAALLKKDKEIAKRKQEYLWKEAELQDTINKHERKLGIHPLGRDRAYRRYWWFSSIPGLFVEHDDELLGDCLPFATPYMPDVDLEDLNFVKANMKKLQHGDREGSDKENSTAGTPKKSSKKKTPVSSAVKKENATIRPPTFGLCTGDKETCPVHSCQLHSPKWSFFWDPDQIDALIDGLSNRGIREKELRQFLVEDKDSIKSYVKKCPVTKLNKEIKYEESIVSSSERRSQRNTGGTSSSKNQNDPNLGFPPGTPIDLILELQLRDLILETEEKVFLGGLGSLKVASRGDWRTAIENRGYNSGTNELSWGGGKTMEVKNKNKSVEAPSADGTETNDDKDSPNSNGIINDTYSTTKPVVKDLACILLQLQQSVELKFLNRPLVEKEDDKKKKNKNQDSEPSWKSAWTTGLPLERWQISLMACTSISQLYVHFYSLESSIEWSRSVLNARCRVCRRKGDPENMLLCDACNKGHHAYCLKPPLDEIPKGDWFCVDCRPAEPLPTPSKKRKHTSEDEIADELESDSDTDTIQRGSKISNSQDDEEPECCAECGYGGEVICCDSCPLVFHLLCLRPPKTRVPRGDWYCPRCTDPKNKRRKVAPKPKGKPSRPVKRRLYESSSEEEDSDIEESESTVNNEKDPSESSNEEGSDAEEEDTPVVKVKFGSSKKRLSPNEATSSRGSRSKLRTIESGSEDEEEEEGGRGSRRNASVAAASKIAQAAKRLRGDSKENESSESSNDATYNSRKRSLDTSDNAGGEGECPKRTRLQRMNTNNKVENGELDNVLLDKLISDVMKQSDAWPFLKPVTRTEAPDYHEIVNYPMDLGTIKYKLNSMVYTCNEEFVSDLLLVFTNCFLYNNRDHAIYLAGQSLKAYCETRCAKLGINFSSDSVAS